MSGFPEVDDIRLQRAPLAEVIAQVRFPPILRIADERPVEFQEKIRGRFPQWAEEEQVLIASGPAEQQSNVKKVPSIFRFQSADAKNTVSLALDFYALSTTDYAHWKDFWAELRRLQDAVQTVYAPSYATRLGLRYVNQFTMSNSGVPSVEELMTLLRPELMTLLRDKPWTLPLELLTQLVLEGEKAPEKLALRIGFKQHVPEPFILLDLDYFVEGSISFEQLEDFYQRAHDLIYRAFRWAIREDKLVLFEPLPVEEV